MPKGNVALVRAAVKAACCLHAPLLVICYVSGCQGLPQEKSGASLAIVCRLLFDASAGSPQSSSC